MRVDVRRKRIVANLFAVLATKSSASPLNQHSKQRPNGEVHSSKVISLPPGLNHIASVDLAAGHRLALEKFRPPKDRVLPPQLNQLPVNSNKRFCFPSTAS